VNNPYSVIVDNEQGWGAMDITFAGTANGRIWLGDTDPDGEGIWYWQLTNGIANPSDTTGSQAVTSAGPLTQPVTGFMVDTNLDVFVGQQVTDAGDTNNVAMEFTHLPATTATWEAGSGNNAFLDINDATIDSRQAPTFVAIALDGPTTGGVQILNAANGRSEITLDPADDYAVTAWDDVGNVYIASPTINRWRVYSPPDGPNQFTTHSAITVQLVTPVTILSVANSNGNVVVTFTAGTTDSASSFTLQSAPTVLGPYTNVSGAIIAMSSPGVFTATAPSPGTNTFYRIARAPAL
jgi:hypothetical protein